MKELIALKMECIKDLLSETGGFSIAVEGDSMLPTLKSGDIVYITPCNRDIKKNDIVLYVYGNNLVLHRIIKLINHSMIVKGDNEETIDIINIDRILGIAEVKKEKRAIKNVLYRRYNKNNIGFVFLIEDGILKEIQLSENIGESN